MHDAHDGRALGVASGDQVGGVDPGAFRDEAGLKGAPVRLGRQRDEIGLDGFYQDHILGVAACALPRAEASSSRPASSNTPVDPPP